MTDNQSKFAGKIVLVTGGTSGIGKAAVIAFAQQGATVIFIGRREEEGQRLMEAIQSRAESAWFIPVDISSETEAEALFKQIKEKFGRLDIAFNNAGIELERTVTEITYAEYRNLFDINVWGIMVAIKHEIQLMLQHGGSIVNTSSIAGHVGVPGFSAYSATKHAIEGLVKTTSLEYAQQGIRINCVAPAFIDTPMVERYIGKQQSAKQHLASLHPMGRLGEPSDIVDAVLFLSSCDAAFITGESLKVDGGWTAQ
ncbi:glucose 1-dehydrogenase [Pseudomonas sp. dw_612]|uniref:SDR family NAD(P)-dependent oxidoreductase n=1 Tax=Pseudomonas sp. dw_612 TaxID=2720080 RepID=UPI001BD242CB|nr:glucose 1-dehydrogenase [Pseudomonas sp. dw_612]